jgi:acyl carrier protein
MTDQEKISLLEDTFEINAGTLKVETELDTVEEYDSMAKLSLIILSDEEFNKKLTGEQIRSFKTIGDILTFLD